MTLSMSPYSCHLTQQAMSLGQFLFHWSVGQGSLCQVHKTLPAQVKHHDNTATQRQNVVTAYFKSKHVLPLCLSTLISIVHDSAWK